MELIRGLHCLNARHRPTVLTIGNFDGVHLGHKAIIDQLIQAAKTYSLPSTVMVFEPQPLEYFLLDGSKNRQAPFRLMPFREKARTLDALTVDQLFCAKFDERFSQYTAVEFISDFLVEGLAVRHLVIGDDFRFGCGREGNYDMLVAAGKSKGFTVERAKTFLLDNERVSSTRIRQLLCAGDLVKVRELLGRPYTLSGRVIQGRQLGRQIEVPTANIALSDEHMKLAGVYVVNVTFADQQNGGVERRYKGVANIGRRPTVKKIAAQGEEQQTATSVFLESHLFDFSGDLYEKRIRVELLCKLRGEKRFDSFSELQAAIKQDIQQAKAWFT